jgi:uncharacterized protein (TIGR03435 family)
LRAPRLLRQLLEDRFALKAHIDRRPLQVYALVTSFKEGRFGPQLREAVTDCPPPPSGIPEPLRPETAPSNNNRMCWGGSFDMGNIRAGALNMRGLAAALTSQGFTDLPVVDRTDLAGNFEIDLRWSSVPLSAVPERGVTDFDLGDRPSLFTALQEQLGLKLERRTEPMDVLVIDHVEPPTPN